MAANNILYIDDDINMLNTGEDILTGAGYEVSLAKSGMQALKLLAKGNHYDLILLDVDMPDMDGYVTFEEIRKLPGCLELPIIFLTGMDAPDFEIKGLKMGAVDYITKPFIKDVFLARIGTRISASSHAPVSERIFDPEKIHELEKTLSSTEIAIAKLVAEGCSNQEIADRTNYSYGYVKKIVSGILDKLYLKNRAELRQLIKN